MVPYGLGWCCNDACRHEATQQRRKSKPRPARKGPTSATRENVKVRDGQRCRSCGSTRDLTIHHVEYRSEGGAHDEHNLLTLCGSCHFLAHSNKYRYQPVLTELLRLHYDEQRYLSVPEVEKIVRTRDLPPGTG